MNDEQSTEQEAVCPECGMEGGPYLISTRRSDDRSFFSSGCPRCGWCY